MSDAFTWSDNGRNVSARSGFTVPIAADTPRASSAGGPDAARTLTLTVGGAGRLLSSNCASGTYIVGGTGSRSDRYTASATTPTISSGGPG